MEMEEGGESMELEEYEHRVEASALEEEEEDPAYEFDAPRYYDFTQTETNLQAIEAERWFESAESYPPSPFLSKLNLQVVPGDETVSPRRMDTDCGVESAVHQVGKNVGFIRGSTLMKPTVSHLAKHRHPYEIRRLLRSRKMRMHSRTIAQKSENDATKRQKLESGYLKKDAQLKHQAVLSHKLCKKSNHSSNDNSRPPQKVTVPKEPRLETARRALRRRSKNSVESSETSKSSLMSNSKERTQFVRKTVKKVGLEDDATENKRQASNNMKRESPYRFKACKLEKVEVQVPKFPGEKHEMPIRLFEKMTIESESRNHPTPQQSSKR